VCVSSRTKQESRKDFGSHRPASAAANNVKLPAIIDELMAIEYKDELIPNFQRVSISGEEMSGVILFFDTLVLVFR
jgi:hypothetical protein